MTLEEKIQKAIRTIPDFPKPGIQFKDITPLLSDSKLCMEIAKALAQPFKSKEVDVVAGVESRGFLFGVLIAHELDRPFTMIRKSGKLPFNTVAQTYDLEYGTATIEMHIDAVEEGQRVLVHDDLLATGGTAQATAELIEKVGGVVAGFNFVIELSALEGVRKLQPYADSIVSLVKY